MTGTTAFFHVDDIMAGMPAVLDAGGSVQQEVQDVGGGRQVGAVADAEGNVIGFIQDA
jgi:predicted enzyme related to lactoylglutathione lyase